MSEGGSSSMNLQVSIYFSFLLFLLGVFGILYSNSIVSLLISFQFIITSSGINFLSFSQFLYQNSVWDKIFIFSGMVSLYVFMFCIIFYSYSSFKYLDNEVNLGRFKLFEMNLSSWWGDDNF